VIQMHYNSESGRSIVGRPDTLLAVVGAVKDYPGQRALDHMDFDLVSGEIHALLGENGAGKSTLIKSISGAIDLDSGTVLVGTTQLSGTHTPGQAIAAGLSVVYQHENLVRDISVTENVLLATGLPRHFGTFVDRRAAREKVRGLLDRVGLETSPDKLVADLGPHEVAMVVIAKALAADARIIVLDEPTTALLPAEVEVLFAQMRRLAQEGIGFIFVTHRLGEVFRIADRITVMRDGRLVGTWSPEELNHDSLVDHLVGPEKSLARGFAPTEQKIGEPVLVVNNLAGPTLKGINFAVHQGEVLGIASLPGEGAPELMETLFGLVRSTGEVTVRGKRARLSSPRAAMNSGFALVPRDRGAQGVVPNMSVADNLTLAVTGEFITDPVFRFIRRSRILAAARKMTEQLRIKVPSLHTSVAALSGGNQQKVVIGRWLMHRADVYLLDSPTAAVDVHAKSEIYGFVRSIADQGAAVLFTSTEVEEFARVCDRVVVLSAGQIVGELIGEEISVNAVLRLSFGRKSA
jgi:ABC-type sugar transport system ATPase subunit